MTSSIGPEAIILKRYRGVLVLEWDAFLNQEDLCGDVDLGFCSSASCEAESFRSFSQDLKSRTPLPQLLSLRHLSHQQEEGHRSTRGLFKIVSVSSVTVMVER